MFCVRHPNTFRNIINKTKQFYLKMGDAELLNRIKLNNEQVEKDIAYLKEQVHVLRILRI